MPRISTEWFEALVDGVPDSAVPADGVLALPVVAVPVAMYGVPIVVGHGEDVVAITNMGTVTVDRTWRARGVTT